MKEASADREAIRAMLRIPRPRTRGDCLAEARPCPWVGCRYHLLLDAPHVSVDERFAGLAINEGRPERGGRRRHLKAWAAELAVEEWTDRALDRLVSMPDTCALDVADRGELPMPQVAVLDGCANVVANDMLRSTLGQLAVVLTRRGVR